MDKSLLSGSQVSLALVRSFPIEVTEGFVGLGGTRTNKETHHRYINVNDLPYCERAVWEVDHINTNTAATQTSN